MESLYYRVLNSVRGVGRCNVIVLSLIFKMASKMVAIIVNDQNVVFRGSNFFTHSLFLLILSQMKDNASLHKITSILVGINSLKMQFWQQCVFDHFGKF